MSATRARLSCCDIRMIVDQECVVPEGYVRLGDVAVVYPMTPAVEDAMDLLVLSTSGEAAGATSQ